MAPPPSEVPGCAGKAKEDFQGMRGSIRPMGEKGEEEASARDDDCFLPRRPPSARMSPYQVIPRRVASLQSPLPFHLVSLFR